MLNEFGSYADAIDSTKNDLTRKNVVPERNTNYCPNVPEIGSRPANLAVPAATWNCNPYLGNFYNYYGNQSYDLSDVHQYDNQKCVNQFPRNYNQHTIQSASVLQCCDPRCQLFSDHSKYPFSNTLANKYNNHNNQRNKRPVPKNEVKPPEPKYATFPYPTPAQNDLNKYNGQQQNYMYQNPVKQSKHVLLPESSSFGDYYTDIGKPSYWNKQNLWNRSVPGSYYQPFEADKVQKMPAPVVHEQNNVNSVNQRGILFNRLLERNRYEAGYMPNYHYGRPPLPQGSKNPAYYQGYPEREVYADIPLQNNSYQNLPLYNVHYVDPTTQCKDPKETKAEEKSRILDKNPNLDVREFLSTWDDVEDDKAPEPEAPVIVLDCTSLQGDALAKVKEKLGDNITDCPIDNAPSNIEFNSHPGNATVLKVVDDQIVSPHTSVIQESIVDQYAKKDKHVERTEKVVDSSHTDGYNMWYGQGHPKKKDDLSYDLVEMTERLVNTVDKLFSEDKPEKETFYEPHKEPEKSEDQWNINFNYKRNNKIEKPPVSVPEPRYKTAVKEDPPYKPFQEFDKEPEKNVSCSFNLQKSNNDLKFSVNYSKQSEYHSSKVQDYSVKYKDCDVRGKFKPARVEDYSYKNYYNSYYYNNPSCEYMQMENVKECTYDVENIDNDNASDITLVKADLEKSLKEITHQFSYQKKIETSEKQLPKDDFPRTVEERIDDLKNDKSENLPTSVIQKTSSHSMDKVYDERDDSFNDNSLLSMPSLSPPRCSTPRNNAVGLTLNDVYENDVLFDTTNKSECDDKAQENRLSFANVVKNADSRDSVVYPLNLALAKEVQPSVVKLTSDVQENDGRDCGTESDPVFKVDDGYYSVEMHFDKDTRNESDAADDTDGKRNIKVDDNAKKHVYKTCIVSPEQFHRPQQPNGLPRSDNQRPLHHMSNGLPHIDDQRSSKHVPNGLPPQMDEQHVQLLPNRLPPTDDQRSVQHLSNNLPRFMNDHIRQPTGLPCTSDNQRTSPNELPHTQRPHLINKSPDVSNEQHTLQPSNGLPCLSNDQQHSPTVLSRTVDDQRSRVSNGLPCLSNDHHSLNGLPRSDNHYSTLYHQSNGLPRVLDEHRPKLTYQSNGLPRSSDEQHSFNGLSRVSDDQYQSNEHPRVLDDKRMPKGLPLLLNDQSNGLPRVSDDKYATSGQFKSSRLPHDQYSQSEQYQSNGLPHILDEAYFSSKQYQSDDLSRVADDQHLPTLHQSNDLPHPPDAIYENTRTETPPGPTEPSRSVLNLIKEKAPCDVLSDIESHKIDDSSSKLHNSSTDDEKLLKSSKFKKYKKHKKMKHRKNENREPDSVIKENGNVTRFQHVFPTDPTATSHIDSKQLPECAVKMENTSSFPILVADDTENLDDDFSKKRKFAAGFVKDADLPVKKRKQTVPMVENFRDERTVESMPLDSAQTNDKYSLNGKYPSPVHSSEQIATVTPTHCSTVDDEYVHRRKKNKKKHKKDKFRVKSKKQKKDRTGDPTKSPERATLVDEINDACKFSYSGSQEIPEGREHATQNYDLTNNCALSVETVANGEQMENERNSCTPPLASTDVELNKTICMEKLEDEHEMFKSREYNRSNDKHAASDGENYTSSYKKLKRYQYDVSSDDETHKAFSQLRTKCNSASVDFENSIVSFYNFKRKITEEKNDLEKNTQLEQDSQIEPYSPKGDSGYNEPESQPNEELNSPIGPFSPQFSVFQNKLSPLKDSPTYDPIPSPKSPKFDSTSVDIDHCPSPLIGPHTPIDSPKPDENDTSAVIDQEPNVEPANDETIEELESPKKDELVLPEVNDPIEEPGSPRKDEPVLPEVDTLPEISPDSPVKLTEPNITSEDHIPEIEPEHVEPSSPHEPINAEPSGPEEVENSPNLETSSRDLENEIASPEAPMNLSWSKEPSPHRLPELEQSIWSGPNSPAHSIDEMASNTWSPRPVVKECEIETTNEVHWSPGIDHEEAVAVEEPQKSIWSNANSPELSDDEENGPVSPVQFIDFDHETIISSSGNQLWSPVNSPFRYESPERRSDSPEFPSVSPERQFLSFERRSVSPECPFVSPERPFVSPERRFVSTKCRSVSPERRFVSPRRRSASPEYHSDSLKRQFHSERQSISPVHRSDSLKRRFHSPERRIDSPEHQSDSADSDDEVNDSKSISSKSSWSKQNSIASDEEAKKSESESEDEPITEHPIIKDDSADDSSSECGDPKIDDLFNDPSVAPTPHCDLNREDEEVAKYDRSELSKCSKMSDISSKAPSPNCILHDDALVAPLPFTLATVLEPPKTTYFSDQCSISSVAPSPNCDIIDGVLLDDTDRADDFDESFPPPSLEPVIACEVPLLRTLAATVLADMSLNSLSTFRNRNLPNCDDVLLDTNQPEDLDESFAPQSRELVIPCEIPSLRTLAASVLANMSFSSLSTYHNKNLLEVWVTPERTEIIIHSEDESNETDLVIGSDNHVMISDACDDEEVNIASNFDKIKEISFDYMGLDSIKADKSEEDVQCQCLIISSEESIVCLRCSLNSSIIVNQDLDLTDYRHEPDVITYQPEITPADSPDSPYTSNCIEDSYIDHKINITPEHLEEFPITDEDKSADVEVENITKLIPQPEQPSQIKIQLPWHKIFNLGQEDQKSLELGPAKIQVRSTPDDSFWKLVDSKNERVSPVVAVKRLVVQRATDIEKRILPGIEEIDEKSTTKFPQTELKSRNQIISRLPKIVIKKTSCKEYKSFLQANIMQPVVKLYKSKSLDELAMRMYRQNNFSINLSELKRFTTLEPEINSSTVQIDHQVQELNHRILPTPQENIKEENIHPVDPVAPRDTKSSKRVLAPKPEYHHCLLCHRSYTSEESYQLHLKSRFHRHLELTQRKTIHAMYRHFTGHICPRLRPLSVKERKKMKWKPRSANVNHFYHQKTPLQIALHKSVFESKPKYENGCS